MTRILRTSTIARVLPKLPRARTLLLLAGLGGWGPLTPRPAHAVVGGQYSSLASMAAYWACRAAGGSRRVCLGVKIVADPIVTSQSPSGVTGFALSVAFDRSRYSFNPLGSGPLCQFAQGGDCPPISSPVGTQPIVEEPPGGLTPGAPLPGSSLSMSDVGGQVNVIYSLASPIPSDEHSNFFLLAFDLVAEAAVDAATATVTYGAPGGTSVAAGADFSQTNFFCTTEPSGGSCSSPTPVSTITTSGFTSTPEPSGVVLLVTGLAALAGAESLRRRCAA